MTDDDRTVDADDSTLDAIRRLARAAEAGAPAADPGPPEPFREVDDTPPSLPRFDASPPPPPIGPSERPETSAEARPGAAPGFVIEELTWADEEPDPPSAEPHTPERRSAPEPAEPWRPPARSIRPTDASSVAAPRADRRWKIAVAVLATLVIVLVVWLFVGGDDGEPAPEVPGDTGVPTVSGEVDSSDGGAGG